MNSALTIAHFTLKKAFREKVYLILLLATAAVVAAAGSVSFYQTGVQIKFLKDVSMFALSSFGFLLALFAATELLPYEMDTRGVHFLASKPVDRFTIVLGKYLALVGLLAANLVPLMAEVFGLVWLYAGKPHWDLISGAGLVLLELAVYGAMVMLLSLVLTRLVAFFSAIFLYAVAHLSNWIATTFLAGSPAWLRFGATAALALVPDLSHFDSRYVVVHGYSVPPMFLAALLAYALLYVAAALLACRWVLESKEL
ncbi:MAG: ABC transporter permease [Candidatus Wallbacteria bacterium]|nr:ABC transporter permease [Candidatus Wallbacteria bacterium]